MRCLTERIVEPYIILLYNVYTKRGPMGNNFLDLNSKPLNPNP